MQSNEMTKPILQNISDSNLSDVVKFFLIFSRFEYALKSAGFLCTDSYEAARPDWNKFSDRIASDLTTRKKEYKELANAIDYLNNKPPRKQIVKPLPNGKKELSWKKIKITPNVNATLSLIESIKRIRNNLFHGGKFPFDPDFDIPLINHATTVLKHLLELDAVSDVKRHYRQG